MSSTSDSSKCDRMCAEIKKHITQAMKGFKCEKSSLDSTIDEVLSTCEDVMETVSMTDEMLNAASCSQLAENFCKLAKSLPDISENPQVQKAVNSAASCQDFAKKLCQSADEEERLEMADKDPTDFIKTVLSSDESSNAVSLVYKQVKMKVSPSISRSSSKDKRPAEEPMEVEFSTSSIELDSAPDSQNVSKTIPIEEPLLKKCDAEKKDYAEAR